jgi:hypothetical protein
MIALNKIVPVIIPPWLITLATSSTPGRAMKVTGYARAAGAILSKAMCTAGRPGYGLGAGDVAITTRSFLKENR